MNTGRSWFNIFARDCKGQPVFLPTDQFTLMIWSSEKKAGPVKTKIITQSEQDICNNGSIDDIATHRVTYYPSFAGQYNIDIMTQGSSLQNVPIKVTLRHGASGAMTNNLGFKITLKSQYEDGRIKDGVGRDQFEAEVKDGFGRLTEVK